MVTSLALNFLKHDDPVAVIPPHRASVLQAELEEAHAETRRDMAFWNKVSNLHDEYLYNRMILPRSHKLRRLLKIDEEGLKAPKHTLENSEDSHLLTRLRPLRDVNESFCTIRASYLRAKDDANSLSRLGVEREIREKARTQFVMWTIANIARLNGIMEEVEKKTGKKIPRHPKSGVPWF